MSCGYHPRSSIFVAFAGTSSLFYLLQCLLLFTVGVNYSWQFKRSASPSVLEFSPNPCPVVPGCKCINNDVTTVECYNIGPDPLAQLVEQYPRLSSLRLIEWTERDFSFDAFSPLKALSKLAVVQSKVHSVFLSTRFPSLTELVLNENAFSDFEQFCNLTRSMPKLESLSLNENQFTHLPNCITDVAVRALNLRKNHIAYVNGTFNENTHIVDLSRNALRSASGFHKNMLRLNLSYNPLTEAAFPPFSLLQQLDLSGTKFIISPRLNAPKLVEFYMDRSTVEMVDFTQWTLPSLQRLSLLESFSLKFISGRLPKSTKEFSVTSTQLSALPQSFFSESSLRGVNVTATDFDCDPCVFQWSVPISNLIKNQTNCAPVARLANCTLGISQHDPEIVRAEYGQSAILSCTAYGSPQPDIEWWRYRPATYLGTFHPFASDRISATNSCCTVLNGGALLLHDVNRSFVERYVCVARQDSREVHKIFHFRLDYSNWYSLDLFNSVFWGGIATAVLVCSFSFLLNITWILTRKSILWWIQRAERLSRVRKMVEAMEKYRVRQMEGLHEKYTRRMQLVRDNYHAQVEALRVSYSSQAERFRDYRAAQMEQMSSHLENIRENYNQQMQRVREYGSRRAEQLWESYERQVNRMKAFSLQHRLKMMRQYKVKQRYLNKLLESFQDSTASPEALRKHEQEVRAALELPDPPPPDSPTETHPLSRSSSFYSLPEYIIDDEGVLRPSPIIGKVRFTPHNIRSQNGADGNSLTKAAEDGPAGPVDPESGKHKGGGDCSS
ncbi:hypothetical protein Y032_0174g451 [Ancylostoma ceylanicum]|uniref:Ig-like domain-containing protein n=1 Tax=Ancylostoma ceylanicum TaxID=53326 RepID=A0A016SU12_9BILA|nr:hypothetical protein Y032_0174g451 [Ancylostoma ceylanicum]